MRLLSAKWSTSKSNCYLTAGSQVVHALKVRTCTFSARLLARGARSASTEHAPHLLPSRAAQQLKGHFSPGLLMEGLERLLRSLVHALRSLMLPWGQVIHSKALWVQASKEHHIISGGKQTHVHCCCSMRPATREQRLGHCHHACHTSRQLSNSQEQEQEEEEANRMPTASLQARGPFLLQHPVK